MRDFGEYGGRYVPETLIPALDELERAWEEAQADDAFHAELHALSTTYVGRPAYVASRSCSSVRKESSASASRQPRSSSSSAGINVSGTKRPP